MRVFNKIHNISEIGSNPIAYSVHFLETCNHPRSVSSFKKLGQFSFSAAFQNLGFQAEFLKMIASGISSLGIGATYIFRPALQFPLHVFWVFVHSSNWRMCDEAITALLVYSDRCFERNCAIDYHKLWLKFSDVACHNINEFAFV